MTKPQKNKSHMLQIRMTVSEMREVRAVAKRKDVGVSELVRGAIARTVQQSRRTKAVNA